MPSFIHPITFLAFSIRSKSAFNCVNRAWAFLSNPVCRAMLTTCENSIDHLTLVDLPWFSRRCISPFMGFVFFLASALCRASRRCSLFCCMCEFMVDRCYMRLTRVLTFLSSRLRWALPIPNYTISNVDSK